MPASALRDIATKRWSPCRREQVTEPSSVQSNAGAGEWNLRRKRRENSCTHNRNAPKLSPDSLYSINFILLLNFRSQGGETCYAGGLLTASARCKGDQELLHARRHRQVATNNLWHNAISGPRGSLAESPMPSGTPNNFHLLN